MAKLRVYRLDVSSMGKFVGIVGACCGPFVVLVMLGLELYRLGSIRMSAVDIIRVVGLGLVGFPAALAFWGVCIGVLVAIVFNLVSRWTGGIVVEAD